MRGGRLRSRGAVLPRAVLAGFLASTVACGGAAPSERGALGRGRGLAALLSDAESASSESAAWSALEAAALRILFQDARSAQGRALDLAFARLEQAGRGADPALRALAEEAELGADRRARALAILLPRGGRALRRALADYLDHPEPSVRARAALALDRQLSGASVERWLRHPDRLVRRAALEGRAGDLKAVPRRVVERLEHDPSPALRALAAKRVLELDRVPVDALGRALADPSVAVTLAAARALWSAEGGSAALGERLRALIGESPADRGVALSAGILSAGVFSSELELRAEERLVGALEHRQATVRAHAAHALRGRVARRHVPLSVLRERLSHETVPAVELALALALRRDERALAEEHLRGLARAPGVVGLRALGHLGGTGVELSTVRARLRSGRESGDAVLRATTIETMISLSMDPSDLIWAFRDESARVRARAALATISRHRDN